MDYHAFPALMAMGAVFGILYHKTGSLRVNIVAHMINNGAALLLT
jgi:membrane protease YdiL (CAAX protease family)